MSVEVRLFGPVSVVVGERRLGPRDFGGRKAKQVLEILALAKGRLVSKDQLATSLWNDDAPKDSDGCLEHYVSLLRRQLRRSREPGPAIVLTGHGGYRLAEHVWVDVAAFEAIETACAGSNDRALVESALALMYRDLLEDEPYADWALEARSYFRQRRLQLVSAAGEIALQERDFDAAVHWGRTAVAIDSLDEASHRCLMLGHYARGERAAALRVFADVSRALVDELGVDAMRATTTLHRAILDEAPIDELLPLRRTPALELRPAGAQRSGLPAPGTIAHLGRQVPLQALLEACTRNPVGACCRPVMVVVEGGSGLGKSRFLDEAAARLPECAVRAVRCAPGMQNVRGALVAEVLAALAPEHAEKVMHGKGLGDAAQDDSVSIAAVRALEQCLASGGRFVVMVDDAHWADAFSIRMLSYLTERNHGVSGAFVLALNDEELRPEHSQLSLRAACRIRLGPLTKQDLEPLAIDDLHAATGGLPVAVVAHVRANAGLPAAIPESYRESVLARIRTLGETAWRVAVASAVTEPQCAPGEVSALLGSDLSDVLETQDRLCGIGLLHPAADGFAFQYPLLRTLLRDTISPARRRLLDQSRARPAASQDACYERSLPARMPAASQSPFPVRAVLPGLRSNQYATAGTDGS